jgi:iron complex outermembrane receptor protein
VFFGWVFGLFLDLFSWRPRRFLRRFVPLFIAASTRAALAEPTATNPSPVTTPDADSKAALGDAAPPAAPITIVVSGTAPPRSASEVTLSKRVLQAAPHQDASEMLRVVPGVWISQHGGEGKAQQIFFRGFDAVHGQDVEFWAGGAPVNDVSNIHGQGYANLHFLIPELVKDVRSQPGNYDPRQADFAVAGSMHYELGYDEPGVTAQASLGSFNSRRYLLAYHPKDSDDGNFGAFEFASTDGFGPSRSARHGSAMVQAVHRFDSIAARVLLSTYSGRYDSAGVLKLEDIETGRIGRFDTYDPKQNGFDSRTQVVAELGQRRGDANGKPVDAWSVSPFLVFHDLKLRSNFTGTLTSSEGDSIQQVNTATTIGGRAFYQRALSLLSNHDSLEAGIYLRQDSIVQAQHRLSLIDDRVTDDKLNPGVQAKVTALDAAGYLDATLHPLKRVIVRGGLRIDSLAYRAEDDAATSGGQTRASQGGQLSKRGTLEVRLLPGLSAVASYGEGFRSPQARSLSEGQTTPFTRVVSFEGGVRYHDGQRFEAAAAAFRTHLSDDLVFDQSTARNERVPGTNRTGVTANMKAEPTAWLVSNTSFTYARAVFDGSDLKYRIGDLLPYVPQVVVRSDFALTPELGHVLGYAVQSHFGVGLTYLGRRPLPYSEMGHDVFLTDLNASVRVGPLRSELAVFNALNADYYDGEFVYASSFGGAASLVPVRHVTVGAPRSVLWSLTVYL